MTRENKAVHLDCSQTLIELKFLNRIKQSEKSHINCMSHSFFILLRLMSYLIVTSHVQFYTFLNGSLKGKASEKVNKLFI